jgi:hypothetical protein
MIASVFAKRKNRSPSVSDRILVVAIMLLLPTRRRMTTMMTTTTMTMTAAGAEQACENIHSATVRLRNVKL